MYLNYYLSIIYYLGNHEDPYEKEANEMYRLKNRCNQYVHPSYLSYDVLNKWGGDC